MHVDYLNLSVPTDHSYDVGKGVSDLMGEIGASLALEGLWTLRRGGTCKIRPLSQVHSYSFSGGILEALRGHDQYENLLSVFSYAPHRVTLMDVAYDLAVDAPPILRKLYRRAKSPDGVHLTRKRISLDKLSHVARPNAFGSGDTGTLYLGGRSAEVRAKVYDKRQERHDNCGGLDVGALTRYELTVTGKTGVSLRDAHKPASIFWHFMSDVIRPPVSLPAWEPSSEGYTLPPKPISLPAARLMRKVLESPDVADLLRLAHESGPNGLNMLLSRLKDRYHEVEESSAGKGVSKAN